MFNKRIIPAIANYKSLQLFLQSHHKSSVILDFHINHLDHIIKEIHKANKKTLVHIDLIKGLCSDKYGAEYLCQRLQVDGIISTKPSPLLTAKANDKLAVQRIFLIDTTSLKRSIDLVNKVQPDYLEVLPALATKIFRTVKKQINIPVIGGGLINDETDISECVNNGLIGVTCSKSDLW